MFFWSGYGMQAYLRGLARRQWGDLCSFIHDKNTNSCHVWLYTQTICHIGIQNWFLLPVLEPNTPDPQKFLIFNNHLHLRLLMMAKSDYFYDHYNFTSSGPCRISFPLNALSLFSSHRFHLIQWDPAQLFWRVSQMLLRHIRTSSGLNRTPLRIILRMERTLEVF